MADFDSLVDDVTGTPNPIPQTSQSTSPDVGDFDSLTDDSDKYGTLGQQAIAGAEGIAKGFAGPVATGIEKHILHVPEEDIKGRQEANPITHGAGEAAGLGAGLLTGTGEATIMTKVGEGAQELAGLANLAKDAAFAHKVGSSAVQMAAENAVLASGDEVSKMILNDPEASAESAIANVGMAAALGGAGGAFITGAVSPLWEATAGKRLNSMLEGAKSVLNRESFLKPPEVIEQDLATLGIQPTAIQRADLSDSPTAGQYIKDLTRAENEHILTEKADLQQKIANSVMEPLGTSVEELSQYDNNAEGRTLREKIINPIKEELSPILEKLDKRNAEAELIKVPDEARLDLRDNMIEKGMEASAGNEDIFNVYRKAADQVLNHENIRGFDLHDTQLFKSAKSLQDSNISSAQRDIRSILKDFKESFLLKAGKTSEKAGVEGASKAAEELVAERLATNKEYAMASKKVEDLGEQFGIHKTGNYKQFIKELEEKLSPEQMLKKFSIRDNLDAAKFLQETNPEAFAEVIKAEQRKTLKTSLASAAKKGDMPIDIKALNRIITDAKSGRSEYLKTIFPQSFLDRAEAGLRVLNQTTKAKDSGTPAGMWGIFKGIGTSALAGVGLATGHGGVPSLLAAELAMTAGKAMPEAGKLAYLRFLGSDQPINAPGFKAMVDFMHNTYKGDTMLSKAAGDVFKAGTQVITATNMPAKADREKLDKIITKLQDAPDKVFALQNGHVGHYLSAHQASLTETSTRAMSYLQTLKPRPFRASPLDAEVPPGKSEVARYNRALDIAQQPAIIMKHIKDGTLQQTDMQDLGAMYPGLYKNMATKLTTEMTDAVSRGEHIPYKTRMSLSLFLGQPLDTTMAPVSIQAAQMAYLPKPNDAAQSHAPKSGSPSKMGKNIKSYQTPLQASEARRMNHK